ncbi:hypothetical protein Mgra_00002682 [Meloidogyne graminicola]|uniref:Uncharacterized protein n=1 Tax=Meloidogyne graminicola TaxID=189291 RepID=A0A8S9ZXM0_9BILA|nr:hypothetical protein Mgra_00002682 [Meloidogyne graminicola]
MNEKQNNNKERESTKIIKSSSFDSFETDGLNKRRQFSQYGVTRQLGIPEIPSSGIGNSLPSSPIAGGGTCPGGSPLPIECDPKRPWPQCPPQSYCYATNSVDIGPYFCCPVWSTYGAAWRPATPFYNYIPPPPPNWPEQIIGSSSPRYGPFRKNRKEQNNEENIEEPEEIEKNIQNIYKTLNRLKKKSQ